MHRKFINRILLLWKLHKYWCWWEGSGTWYVYDCLAFLGISWSLWIQGVGKSSWRILQLFLSDIWTKDRYAQI